MGVKDIGTRELLILHLCPVLTTAIVTQTVGQCVRIRFELVSRVFWESLAEATSMRLRDVCDV